MRGWLALVCALAAVWIPSMTRAEGREGELYRAAIGGGYVAGSEGEFDVFGGGMIGSFAVGWFLVPNLAMHVDSFGSYLLDPGVDTPKGEGGVNGSLAHVAIGAGVTYYFMPANIYIAPSVGTGLAWLSVGPFTGSTDLGLAVNLLAGKEWFVSSDIGLGVALQGQTYVLSDEQTMRSFGGGLLFSLSYDEGSRPTPIRYRYESPDAQGSHPTPAAARSTTDAPLEVTASAAELAPTVSGTDEQTAQTTAVTPAVPPPASSGGTRTISGRGYALDVPAGWVDAVSGGTELLRVREGQLQSGTFATVALQVEYFTGDSAAFAAAHAGRGTVHERQPATVAGLAGAAFVRDGDTPQQRVLQYLVADGGAGYVLSCTMDTVRFGSERATCERILQSFRFTQVR